MDVIVEKINDVINYLINKQMFNVIENRYEKLEINMYFIR